MIKVAVLYGGTSDEKEVSLRSGTAVAEALEVTGYEVIRIDTGDNGLDLRNALSDADCAFPALHGRGGEDGSIQKLFEATRVPFVGSSSISSALTFDKWRFKEFLLAHDILTPRGELVTGGDIWQSELTTSPFVLKPYDGGSSIDTFIVRDTGQVPHDAIDESFKTHERMLLEELIQGSEITIGVMEGTTLPVIEIIPPSEGEFDYTNKYNGASRELCPPENISAEVQAEAATIAQQIHKLAGLGAMSRTDIIISATDRKLYVLETNTIPGMTAQSLFPKAAAVAGYDMPKLCDLLVQSALRRAQSQKPES